MLTDIFNAFSSNIAHEYKSYISEHVACGCDELDQLYKGYTSLDSFYPRPILTYLGTKYTANNLAEIPSNIFPKIIFIPQIVRDFLAIHDDIIDEDLIKFNTDTLPYAISKLYSVTTDCMTKKGMSLSILFADYIIPVIYDIAIQTNHDDKTKLALVDAINRVLYKTNVGQIVELDLEQRSALDINENEILSLYDKKAADYCYAFPFELGLIYAGAPHELIEKARAILLQIGACSQIVNDIEGIFFENYDDERDTFSDLLELRRTYLLVKLAKLTTSEVTLDLLGRTKLTISEANSIKNEMVACHLLDKVTSDIKQICSKLYCQIDNLDVGTVVKAYFKDLIDQRVLNNLAKAFEHAN